MSAPRSTVLALATMLAVMACQGPSVPALTDPVEILAAAVRTTAEQTSVRVDVAVDGRVAIDILGSGGTPIALNGTTATADIDLEAGSARTTFSAPSVLGLTGEVIAVDGTTYIKTTLTGPLYVTQSMGVPVPDASGDPTTILDGLTDLLAQPGLEPVKGEDVQCGNTTCYSVTIELTPDELAALGGFELPASLPIPIPIPDLGDASVALSVRVAQDTTRLAGLLATVDLGDAGDIEIDLVFSKWGDAVTIAAPPDDEVAGGG
jgi:hypothetical protein